ncbi:MAG: hypothetical protein LUG21_05660 [Clostridiales bacterium]|nr:hypothetical protein [Clostridiales bacterium]
MDIIDYLNSKEFRYRARRACYTYIGCIVLAALIGLLVTLLSSCGTSGEIASGNVTNVYINSSITNDTSTVQLVSDDYIIQSIETQDEGARLIVTLVRKNL